MNRLKVVDKGNNWTHGFTTGFYLIQNQLNKVHVTAEPAGARYYSNLIIITDQLMFLASVVNKHVQTSG